MGYASAIAVTLFLIIMLVTMVQFRLRKSWVNNE
jgi:multiple sugar transport system permease protein